MAVRVASLSLASSSRTEYNSMPTGRRLPWAPTRASGAAAVAARNDRRERLEIMFQTIAYRRGWYSEVDLRFQAPRRPHELERNRRNRAGIGSDSGRVRRPCAKRPV